MNTWKCWKCRFVVLYSVTLGNVFMDWSSIQDQVRKRTCSVNAVIVVMVLQYTLLCQLHRFTDARLRVNISSYISIDGETKTLNKNFTKMPCRKLEVIIDQQLIVNN